MATMTTTTPKKPAAPKRRHATRAKPATVRSAVSAISTRDVPQWLTIGASVAGAAIAIGATLFATRNEWLPRARSFGDWVDKSVHDQFDNISAVAAKVTKKRKAATPPTPHADFDASGASAGFAVN